MSEKRNVPKLRFPEFSGYLLVQKPFRDVVESNIYGPRFNANDYDQSGNVKTIRGTDVDRNGGFKYEQIPTARLDEKLINTHKLKKGDLVMITTADCGLTGVFEEQKLPHISSAYGVRIRLNSKGNPYFFRYFFQTRPAKAQIDSFIRKATVSNLPGSDILKIKVHLPSLPEQQKIAEFLKAVDQRIELLQAKKEKLEAYKKGVMQKIFSQQLRFKADDGSEFPDWEERKLGEIIQFSKGKGLPKSDITDAGPLKCIHYGELFTKYKEHITHIKSRTFEGQNMTLSKKNDVLMPTSDVTPNGLATASCIKETGVILGGDILILRQKVMLLDGIFLAYFISQNRKEVMRRVAGSTVYHLYGSDMKTIMVQVPTLEEQKKIVSFLTSLDSTIDNLNQQINQTQTWKKGLLQKMFV